MSGFIRKSCKLFLQLDDGGPVFELTGNVEQMEVETCPGQFIKVRLELIGKGSWTSQTVANNPKQIESPAPMLDGPFEKEAGA